MGAHTNVQSPRVQRTVVVPSSCFSVADIALLSLMKVLVFVYAALALAWAGVGAELVETGSVACDFPNEPQFLQPPVCPPTTLTRENATSLAWQFAPEMRFHSLEESFMLDPSTYFEQVRRERLYSAQVSHLIHDLVG